MCYDGEGIVVINTEKGAGCVKIKGLNSGKLLRKQKKMFDVFYRGENRVDTGHLGKWSTDND